ESHRLALRLFEDSAVVADLRLEPRKALRHHELELGAVKPDALGTRFAEMGQIDQKPGIDAEIDVHAVARHRRTVAQGCKLRLTPGIEAHLVGIGALELGGGTHMYFACLAV